MVPEFMDIAYEPVVGAGADVERTRRDGTIRLSGDVSEARLDVVRETADAAVAAPGSLAIDTAPSAGRRRPDGQ